MKRTVLFLLSCFLTSFFVGCSGKNSNTTTDSTEIITDKEALSVNIDSIHIKIPFHDWKKELYTVDLTGINYHMPGNLDMITNIPIYVNDTIKFVIDSDIIKDKKDKRFFISSPEFSLDSTTFNTVSQIKGIGTGMYINMNIPKGANAFFSVYFNSKWHDYQIIENEEYNIRINDSTMWKSMLKKVVDGSGKKIVTNILPNDKARVLKIDQSGKSAFVSLGAFSSENDKGLTPYFKNKVKFRFMVEVEKSAYFKPMEKYYFNITKMDLGAFIIIFNGEEKMQANSGGQGGPRFP